MAELEKIDKSDWLDNTKKYCEAANPSSKQKMWEFYFSDSEEISNWGLHSYQNSFRGFNQVNHREFTKQFED